MRRTYLDTGVLIEAVSGRGSHAAIVLRILSDPSRIFLSCPYLDLEVLPQVILNHRPMQRKFLEAYLAATERIEDLKAIFDLAFREARRSPVSGMDALHVAAAHLLRADELITTERAGRAIYRNSLVAVLPLSGR